MTTAAEHFDQSAQRALGRLDMGDAPLAIASLTTDLDGHEETRGILTSDLRMPMVGEFAIHGIDGVRRCIADLPCPAVVVES